MDPDLLRKGLKISHLRVLAGLAETGQIGATAHMLGIAQPAASRLIGEVERIVDRPIRVRTGRGVVLTEEGAALARRAGRILLELDEAGRELAEMQKGAQGHVRIGSVTGPALDIVLPAIRRIRTARPAITVGVEVAPSDTLCLMLTEGRIDVALGRIPLGTRPGLLDMRPIGTEPLALLARAGHPLAGARLPTRAALMAQDWVLPEPEAILRQTVVARLLALGLPMPRVPVETASFLLTLALIRNSDAVAAVALPVAQQFAGDQFARLPDDLGLEVPSFGVLTRSGSRQTPAAMALIDEISRDCRL